MRRNAGKRKPDLFIVSSKIRVLSATRAVSSSIGALIENHSTKAVSGEDVQG
jgi:hypothetical protein